MISELKSVYEMVGGDDFFKKLAEEFYSKIDNDDLLRYMFPEDLTLPKKWNYLFLRMVFGGPDDYTPQRGHPRMRKRHLPFKIGMKEAKRWLKLMIETLDDIGMDKNKKERVVMEKYFQMMATKMINQPVLAEEYE